jgi:VWFA-related protein
MCTRSRSILTVLLTLSTFITTAISQDVLRVDTDLVMIEATVLDASGRSVKGLGVENFRLFEDEEERPISFFHVEKKLGQIRPLALVFALDISGSISVQEFMKLRQAVRLFAEKLVQRPSVFSVMTFGISVKVIQPFTSDLTKLERSFERLAKEPNGLTTHIYDAMDDGIRQLTRHAPRSRGNKLLKRTIIVVTDGFPVGDTVSPETVIERANQQEVSIYTVTLPSYSSLFLNSKGAPVPTPLDISKVAEKTGGRNLYANEGEFETLFKALAEEVSSTYLIAYYPDERKRNDGRFHKIRVQVPKGYSVKLNREGYTSSMRD